MPLIGGCGRMLRGCLLPRIFLSCHGRAQRRLTRRATSERRSRNQTSARSHRPRATTQRDRTSRTSAPLVRRDPRAAPPARGVVGCRSRGCRVPAWSCCVLTRRGSPISQVDRPRHRVSGLCSQPHHTSVGDASPQRGDDLRSADRQAHDAVPTRRCDRVLRPTQILATCRAEGEPAPGSCMRPLA